MPNEELIEALAQAIVNEIESRQGDGEEFVVLDLPEYAEAMATAIVENVATNVEIADVHYVHNQNSPNAVWSITHNLGKYPSVAVEASDGVVSHGIINYTSINALTITFSAAFSGRAFLN